MGENVAPQKELGFHPISPPSTPPRQTWRYARLASGLQILPPQANVGTFCVVRIDEWPRKCAGVNFQIPCPFSEGIRAS